MRALLVGAGAVGQVYGRHLQQGGAEVSFLVRPRYADEARRGFPMYPLNRRGARKAPVRFEGFSVLTEAKEANGRGFDAVLLCVSSTALRKGDWVREVAEATGDATIVSLQPGIEDHAYTAERADEGRIVSGLINLLSYPGPLPGEDLPEPGVAYYTPPMAKTPFSGPAERAKAVADAFTKGGLPSKVVADVPRMAAFGSGFLLPHMAALECAGWSFSSVRHAPWLGLAHRATREAHQVAAHRLGQSPPFAMRLLLPFHVALVTRLAPWVLPLDIETYLRVHFTKVGDQTSFALETFMGLGRRYGLKTEAIARLHEELAARRA